MIVELAINKIAAWGIPLMDFVVHFILTTLFHLAGFDYFPVKIQPWMQVGLLAIFLMDFTFSFGQKILS